jgi:WhiB family transcriptional regulator, redox-sensing transcriptional regulator
MSAIASESGWESRAACAGLDTAKFVPSTERTPPPPWVIEVCSGCPVRAECLQVAVAGGWRGYWAGTSTYQRRTAHHSMVSSRRRSTAPTG